jgi:hypothetical protein
LKEDIETLISRAKIDQNRFDKRYKTTMEAWNGSKIKVSL